MSFVAKVGENTSKEKRLKHVYQNFTGLFRNQSRQDPLSRKLILYKMSLRPGSEGWLTIAAIRLAYQCTGSQSRWLGMSVYFPSIFKYGNENILSRIFLHMFQFYTQIVEIFLQNSNTIKFGTYHMYLSRYLNFFWEKCKQKVPKMTSKYLYNFWPTRKQ